MIRGSAQGGTAALAMAAFDLNRFRYAGAMPSASSPPR